ncbi:hypothetical protein C8P68_10411 [Mucilaginibacter yixingensis]|uniref:Uncharacterized protein n=1 Tax=Mucilaginibacter yixingensis TaxID=1295612 RepID=A0A2T5J8Y9_9SPHI|nr:hypothetical protein C8P68_10411 [Mucilaginibacter yixingensis]
MKIIKLNPKTKKSIQLAIVTAFLYRDANVFKNTRLQFLKNNPDFFNNSSGLTA